MSEPLSQADIHATFGCDAHGPRGCCSFCGKGGISSHLLGEDEPCERCGSRLANCECPAEPSVSTPVPSSEGLITRLRHYANETWPFAEAVSNLGHPERDNNFGRAATAMREAADALSASEAEVQLRDALNAQIAESQRLLRDRDAFWLRVEEQDAQLAELRQAHATAMEALKKRGEFLLASADVGA